jgi:hypothetical protein
MKKKYCTLKEISYLKQFIFFSAKKKQFRNCYLFSYKYYIFIDNNFFKYKKGFIVSNRKSECKKYIINLSSSFIEQKSYIFLYVYTKPYICKFHLVPDFDQ